MPIEVREIVIRARVEDQQGGQSATGSASANNGGSGGRLSERELQNIISMCAEEVMKIIKRQKER